MFFSPSNRLDMMINVLSVLVLHSKYHYFDHLIANKLSALLISTSGYVDPFDSCKGVL